MKRFKHPQNPLHLLGRGIQIADEHLPVRIGGDAALLQGFSKVVLSEESIDSEFISSNTSGFEQWQKHISSASWEEIEIQSGISRESIERVGKAIANSKRMIVCWARPNTA